MQSNTSPPQTPASRWHLKVIEYDLLCLSAGFDVRKQLCRTPFVQSRGWVEPFDLWPQRCAAAGTPVEQILFCFLFLFRRNDWCVYMFLWMARPLVSLLISMKRACPPMIVFPRVHYCLRESAAFRTTFMVNSDKSAYNNSISNSIPSETP